MPASRLHIDLSVASAAVRRMPGLAGLFKTACRFGLLLMGLACLPAQAAQQVTLLLSEPGGIYQEAAQAFQREFTRDAEKWIVRTHNVDATPRTDGVVVAFGVRALQYALSKQGDDPLLAVLVPALAFEKLISALPKNSTRRHISALYLDQPFSRQLQLIRLAMPQAKRVGVLVSPATDEQSSDLINAGRLAGLDVDVRTVHNQEQVFASLDALAQKVDALLLLPDSTVVNRDILKIVFVKAYRQRLPIVAYSSGLVQAGALLGLHATPAQLGAEAGRWLREMPLEKGGRLAAPSYPKSFTVDVNQNVARSLELTISSGEFLARGLEEESGR